MSSTRFQPGNPGGGRPRGRISKFRELLGDATRDGAEIVEELTAIWRDRENPVKERREALALGLAYLLGKPEAAVELTGAVDVTARATLDVRALVASLPTEVVAAAVAALDAAEPALLEAGDDGDG